MGEGRWVVARHYDYYYNTQNSRVDIQRQSRYRTVSSYVNEDASVMYSNLTR